VITVYTLTERFQLDIRCCVVLHFYVLAIIRKEKEQKVFSYVRGI